MTRDEWLAVFAEATGRPVPDEATVDALLEVAGVAAHASERTAAPITCWLVGAAGLDVAEARAIADRLAERLTPATTGTTDPAVHL